MASRASTTPPDPRNTLGLSGPALETVFETLDAGASSSAPPSRAFARWPLRHAALRVALFHADGARLEIFMACRNLSRTGASLLHRSFVYPGTVCEIELPGQETTRALGSVVRCQHRTGVIHEIGVAFNSPIQLREVLRPDPLRQWFETEQVGPHALEGTVLLIDPDAGVQQQVRDLISETRIDLIAARDRSAALEAAAASPDLILCSTHAWDQDAATLLRDIRSAGGAAPAILIGEPTPSVQSATRAGLAHSFLCKPINGAMLLRAMADFLGNHAPDSHGPVPREVIDALAPDIRECVETLGRATGLGETAEAINACNNLGKLVGALQMDDAADEIEAILASLNQGEPPATVAPLIDHLTDTCLRAL